jgi:hypothetical protein
MELGLVIGVAIAIIFVACAWGMAYGWHRGWEDARLLLASIQGDQKEAKEMGSPWFTAYCSEDSEIPGS